MNRGRVSPADSSTPTKPSSATVRALTLPAEREHRATGSAVALACDAASDRRPASRRSAEAGPSRRPRSPAAVTGPPSTRPSPAAASRAGRAGIATRQQQHDVPVDPGRQPAALPGVERRGLLRIRPVPRRRAHHQDQVAGQVGVQIRCPGGDLVRIGDRAGEQVLQQIPPAAVGHLGQMPVEQQQQRGHHGAALQHPQVGRPRRAVAGQHQPAEHLGAGRHRHRRLARPDRFARRGRHLQIDRAAQQLGEFGGDLGHPAAAQHQFGEPVVREHGQLGVPALFAQRGVGVLETDQRGPGLGQQPGVVQRDGGVRGQRGQQRDLVPGEVVPAPVGGEQHADHLRAALERHPQDRDQALVADRGVDGRPVCWNRSSRK